MEKLEIQEYNLNIKLDGVVNIIGLPASGKTYLLKKLINKIPSTDIFIDGQNIKNLPLDYLQKNIAVVFNDNKFNTEYAEEELIYYQDKLGISRDLSTEKIKNLAKYFNIEELLVSKINLLKENEKILIKILSLLIINPSILGIDNLLTYLTIENKMKLLKYAKENNITILSVTNNKEELRKTARGFYQFDNGGNLPTIVSNCQPEYLRKPIGDTSKRAKMIYTFETISPRELLISKNKGNEPTRRDLRLVEDLLLDYNLKPGVVNVLIDYILNINDKKLTRGLVETMAGEWQRKGIETVEDAMSLCEKEHKKRNKKVIEEKKVNVKTPDWFDKEIEKNKINDGEDNQLEELLKEYK